MRSTGKITADPNPVRVAGVPRVGITTVYWEVEGDRQVEVRVNAPDGVLLARSAGSGSATTGNWVTDGMTFYLQDVSNGQGLTSANTLGAVMVEVTAGGSDQRAFSATARRLPDLYPFVEYLCDRFECSRIIDIGCRLWENFSQLSGERGLIGIGGPAELERCRHADVLGGWLEWEVGKSPLPLTPELLKDSAIVCADLLRGIDEPDHLLDQLKLLMEHARVCVLTTPDRTRAASGVRDKSRARWSLVEFEKLLRDRGFNVAFTGWTKSEAGSRDKSEVVAVIENDGAVVPGPANRIGAPPGFRVVAVVAAYNEDDIVVPSLQRLIGQGVGVYLIDNWSTDATERLARQFEGRGLIGLEKFPKEGPSKHYEWRALLTRIEQLTSEIEADWFIHTDVDEVRVSPWPGVSLREGLYVADQAGFNCVDHTVVNFPPVDNLYAPGTDFERHLRRFEFGRRAGHFVQLKAWKNQGGRVSLADSGGHEVRFEGRRIYPYKFLLKHFPIRSAEHAQKKVFVERRPRYAPDERATGWHTHYDGAECGNDFLRPVEELELFDGERFSREYLIERLSGIGLTDEHISSPYISNARPAFCTSPNIHARAAGVEEYEDSITIHGYQEFLATKEIVQALPEDSSLSIKQELLRPYFSPRFLAHRNVLDLGSSAGFFCFWAVQNGAQRALAVDIDENYLGLIQRASDKMGIKSVETARANVSDWVEPADVVLALALLHWIHSCTAGFGSLDAALGKLSELTRYMLLVEWVAPEDPAIQLFNHLEWNRDIVQASYEEASFKEALERHFTRHELIGEVSPTRRLYAAFKSDHEIDLSGPLPFIHERESVVSARLLARSDGVEYWSRVYDRGDTICKQASLDLAEREAYFLSQLSGDHFPRVIDTEVQDGYSVVILEKIQGKQLSKVVGELGETPAKLHRLLTQCIDILDQLEEKSITHRDIRPENILVRDGGPVLIDFGWAVSPERPYQTPPGLGGAFRPPDGSFSDVYSMGRVMRELSRNRHPKFDTVIELMAEPDAGLRLSDLSTLRSLFDAVAEMEE